jgi:hypothetical protein
MRRPFSIAGLVIALSFGGAPAFAFEETPVPPPAPAEQGHAPSTQTPMKLGSPDAPAKPDKANKGMKLFGYSIFPKLDFGLELLYGQDQQQLQLQQTPTPEESGDVSVLGKVKRSF